MNGPITIDHVLHAKHRLGKKNPAVGIAMPSRIYKAIEREFGPTPPSNVLGDTRPFCGLPIAIDDRLRKDAIIFYSEAIWKAYLAYLNERDQPKTKQP